MNLPSLAEFDSMRNPLGNARAGSNPVVRVYNLLLDLRMYSSGYEVGLEFVFLHFCILLKFRLITHVCVFGGNGKELIFAQVYE